METVEAKPMNHYNKYVKPRLESDPEFRHKYIQSHVRSYTKRYKNDEEFRKKRAEVSRVCMANRYNTDEEYRAKQQERCREYYHKKKALKLASLTVS
jgi:hypothetical protein